MQTTEPIELWRVVWRHGVVPHLKTEGLQALREALAADSPALLQGATVEPPPLKENEGLEATACCPLCLALRASYGAWSVAEVLDLFDTLQDEAERTLGEPAALRHLLNWLDDTPRDDMRRELLAEVERVLACRGEPPAADQPAA